MGSRPASALLQLPVRLHGIQLGRPVDLLLDVATWNVIGFVVLCGDESLRFLPYAAAQTSDEEIAVASALMLLEDTGFYEKRGVSFRALLEGDVARRGTQAGRLRDVLIGRRGEMLELELDRDGERRTVPAPGSTVIPTRAAA